MVFVENENRIAVLTNITVTFAGNLKVRVGLCRVLSTRLRCSSGGSGGDDSGVSHTGAALRETRCTTQYKDNERSVMFRFPNAHVFEYTQSLQSKHVFVTTDVRTSVQCRTTRSLHRCALRRHRPSGDWGCTAGTRTHRLTVARNEREREVERG